MKHRSKLDTNCEPGGVFRMEDEFYMREALELARRGAGLVSPNPMVGAVLVKGGRVVGEGFHRYDRLKHAESYAIEMAGEQSRGATLYCSLEPCCHYGRTPPCTDALIEAGIARAVVAVTDLDRRMRGLGIEQLRSAGISVEVGLCEDEAHKLNESYFKFVTTDTPFVHAVVDQLAPGAGSIEQWHPSSQLLRLLAEYDAIILGECARLNRLVIDAALSRERHRKLIVVGTTNALRDSPLREAIIIKVASDSSDKTQPRTDSLFRMLAGELRVTGAALLPGALDADLSDIIESVDKMTILYAGSAAFEDQRARLSDIATTRAGEFIEVTGYPGLTGAA